jgi:hypothetical protein
VTSGKTANRMAMKRLTPNKARRIAANIAKLLGFCSAGPNK